MGQRPSCRSCRHCIPPGAVEPGWCQLRQLPIHPDLAGELWCHHWTARSPRLPGLGPSGGGRLGQPEEGQLVLGDMLRES